MRIGIYAGDQVAIDGGGYTYQVELLEAFAGLAAESPHEFIVFASPRLAAGLHTMFFAANVKVAELAPPTWRDRLQGMLQRDFSYVRTKWRSPGRLQRAVLSQGVEYVWFLGSDCHLLDVPYLAVVWDIQHRTLPWFPELTHRGEFDAREAANAWFLRRAAGVITGTRTGAAQVEYFYQVSDSVIKPLPQPTPAFALKAGGNLPQGWANVPAKYGVNGRYLIYPAQFWAHKNHVNLLYAIQYLRKELATDISLVLLGSDKGNKQFCMRVAADLGLQNCCHFLGFIPRDDLVALYAGAVALSYVSYGGPDNLPPLEAFALGCPVVAADIPGAREQLEDCALFVDPSMPADMALAFKRLADGGMECEALVARGRIRAARWTGRDFVRGVFKIFDQFAAVRRNWGRS